MGVYTITISLFNIFIYTKTSVNELYLFFEYLPPIHSFGKKKIEQTFAFLAESSLLTLLEKNLASELYRNRCGESEHLWLM